MNKQKIINTILSILVTFTFSANSFSQHYNSPLNHNFNYNINNALNRENAQLHSTIKPIIKSTVYNSINLDTIAFSVERYNKFEQKNKFLRKVFVENNLVVDTGDFYLTIDVLFNFNQGKNSITDSALSVNTRGVFINGEIGESFSFQSTFFENQAFFPDYVRDDIKQRRVVPGQGSNRAFKTWGSDFAYATGNVSIDPTKTFNIKLGHGKNFIGDGYRSLMISDNSHSYPYLRLTKTHKKWQYTNILSNYQMFVLPYDTKHKVFARKYSSTNFLNWIISDRLHLGFFETVLWKTAYAKSDNYIDVNFFNPLIFFRTFQYGLDHSNNVISGINLKLKISRGVQAYGQFIVDDIKLKPDTNIFKNKTGYQVGIKFFDFLSVKNLYLQAEYNSVKPYTYSHEEQYQSYTNFNQEIAHPLGANFNEFIAMLNYNYRNFFIELKLNSAKTSTDTLDVNYGSNVFNSFNDITYNDDLSIGRGVETSIIHKGFKLGYLINKNTNLHLFIGLDNRTYINSIDNKTTNYYSFGIRTWLRNEYYDF